MSDKKQQPNQLSIEMPDEHAEIYSNLAMIGHLREEFMFDFIRVYPGTNKAKVRSRVIMAPVHAKRLLLALKENIDKYEANFGHIDVGNPDNNQFPPIGFSGPAGRA
jgi:hypothetical protein